MQGLNGTAGPSRPSVTYFRAEMGANMRLTEIRGLPVIDPMTARKVGVVSNYYVDAVGGRLAAIEVDGDADPLGGRSSRIPAAQIRRLGHHAVMLTRRPRAEAGQDSDAPDSLLDARQLDGLEVMGDDGRRIGQVADANVDPDSLHVQAFVLRTSFLAWLLNRNARLAPASVASASTEMLLVRRLAAESAATHEATIGAGADLTTPLNFLRRDGADAEARGEKQVRAG